ncbi:MULTISPECIES: hypothetical protein [Marinitoga]|nr:MULTISPECIES: hypothetical protein [Marinitoga]MBM7560451.1 hypothetical protein [Marinitoga litoralis]
MQWIEKNNDYMLEFEISCSILRFICPCFGVECLIACKCDGNGICYEKG